MRFFPYGKAALSILVLAVLSGLWLALQPAQEHTATLTYWTFAKPHYESYIQSLPAFERAHPGVTVDLELVSNNALAARMQSAMLANLDVPDIFEMEIGQAGALFRGPAKDIGLLDITSRVRAPGPNGTPSLWDRMVQARFAPFTNRGSIYGLPHDVHPVQLAYRRDIFLKEGIDPEKIKTWDDFIQIGRKLTIPGQRYMIELNDSDATMLETMLFQRGGGYFDANGDVIMDNETAVQTMCWYVPLVTGPHKIANSVGLFNQAETKAAEDGYLLCYICPDWRSKNFENDVAHVSGKMALMPLPAVAPGARPTSTWGGTMVGITKHCKVPDLAWQLATFLAEDRAGAVIRFRATNILPPVKTLWDLPVIHEPRTYWSGQRLGDTYMRLADDVPAHYTSPVIQTATDKLGQALVDCVRFYNAQGYVDRGDARFEDYVRARLKKSADQVRAMIARDEVLSH
ncbi:MAG: extracellular solute-binding protein [Armatimonadetes bacterium]|nr:extracellular solute-binding protein [Armatimonadota bacterium]